MAALGIVFMLAGVFPVFFADEIVRFVLRRNADDSLTNPDAGLCVGIAAGAATLAIADFEFGAGLHALLVAAAILAASRLSGSN